MGKFMAKATPESIWLWRFKPEYAQCHSAGGRLCEKEIIRAMYARKTYADERWMVVVSSSHWRHLDDGPGRQYEP